jgi:hypothetical protein
MERSRPVDGNTDGVSQADETSGDPERVWQEMRLNI